MIKLLIALFLAQILYTLSLVITTILVKDKLKTIFLGNPNGKEYFRFKIFNTDIRITSWFFLTNCVETDTDISKKKYLTKVFISTIVSLFILYICTFTVNIANYTNYNENRFIIKQTNELVINDIKDINQGIIHKKTDTSSASAHENNLFDIFFKVTFLIILFNLVYNSLKLFMAENIAIISLVAIVIVYYFLFTR